MSYGPLEKFSILKLSAKFSEKHMTYGLEFLSAELLSYIHQYFQVKTIPLKDQAFSWGHRYHKLQAYFLILIL